MLHLHPKWQTDHKTHQGRETSFGHNCPSGRVKANCVPRGHKIRWPLIGLTKLTICIHVNHPSHFLSLIASQKASSMLEIQLSSLSLLLLIPIIIQLIVSDWLVTLMISPSGAKQWSLVKAHKSGACFGNWSQFSSGVRTTQQEAKRREDGEKYGVLNSTGSVAINSAFDHSLCFLHSPLPMLPLSSTFPYKPPPVENQINFYYSFPFPWRSIERKGQFNPARTRFIHLTGVHVNLCSSPFMNKFIHFTCSPTWSYH